MTNIYIDGMKKTSYFQAPRYIFSFIILSVLSSAVAACNGLVGYFSLASGGSPAFHITKEEGYFYLSIFNNEKGAWEEGERSMHLVQEAPETNFPFKVGRSECGLIGWDKKGLSIWFLKVSSGVKYGATSTDGKDPSAVRINPSKTGFLMFRAWGVGFKGGVDIYPISTNHIPPEKWYSLQKQLICNNGSPVDFAPDKLPPDLKAYYDSAPKEDKLYILCGNSLNYHLTNNFQWKAPTLEERKKQLQRVKMYAGLGSIPRTDEGQENWWGASSGLLDINYDNRTIPPPPLQEEFGLFFCQALLPKLERAKKVDRDHVGAFFTIAKIRPKLPCDMELFKAAAAAADWSGVSEEFKEYLASKPLLDSIEYDLPEETGWILQNIKISDLENRQTLREAIEKYSPKVVLRILSLGVKPFDAGVRFTLEHIGAHPEQHSTNALKNKVIYFDWIGKSLQGGRINLTAKQLEDLYEIGLPQ